MDLLNTFLVFNVIGCIGVLLFGVLTSARFANAKTQINLAGVSGLAMGVATMSLVARMFM